MVSFAFFLCSALLLSGAIAAPFPGESDDNTAVSAVAGDEIALVEANQTLAEEITQQASQAGVKVLTDLLDGKDLQSSLLDRSVEALGKVRGEIASIGHSALKRLKELKNGLPLEKVAGNIWKSVQKKFAGKSKNFDEVINSVGLENVTKFVESATKVIKESITDLINKRKEAKALKEAESAVDPKLVELAKEVKAKAE